MGEMTDYGRRLCEAMGVPEGKAPSIERMRALAKEVELSYQAIKKLFATDGQRSNSMAAANNSRAARWLKVNPDWLATGEGTKELVYPRPEELQALADIRVLEVSDPAALKAILELMHLNADSFRRADDELARFGGSNGYHPATNIKPAPTTPPAEAKRPKAPQKAKSKGD